MALFRTVVPILKFTKPILVNPCFVIPNSVNMQVRYAARKGYREKVKRQKKEALKDSPKLVKDFQKLKRKVVSYERTVNLKKPEPPSDDIFIRDNFNYVKYSLSEAVKLHREYHHPTVYNNPNAVVNLKIEVNMMGKTQTQILKPFSGIAAIPHPFVVSFKREVLVLCNSQDVDLALSCGASVAGSDDIIKKIKDGTIQPSLYDYIISHISLHPQLSPIRSLLKNQLPRAKLGNLTSDLKSAIHRFLHGIEYSCTPLGASKDTGFIHCSVGLINMELEQLEENLIALIKELETHRNKKLGDFITWIWCSSPPSPEEFSLDLSKYIQVEKEIDDDDEEVEVKEQAVLKQLKWEHESKEMFEEKI